MYSTYPNPVGYVPMAEAAGEDEEDPTVVGASGQSKAKALPIWGNPNTMNMNPLILTNIQNSPYFKVHLFNLKTYHEVIDEIYEKVDHLEPWERGSRKTSGQTGMCGGVRGVGAGGIVSSAYCLLYKLATLKLTRKQVNGLINHSDSPYIRGLGFMYIRYTQSPTDFWDWFQYYLDDEELIDVKAGGGKSITIGEMVRSFMERLEWFDTRFPRIPINVQKILEQNLLEARRYAQESQMIQDQFTDKREAKNISKSRSRSRERERDRRKGDNRHRRYKSRSRSRSRNRDKNRDRRRSRSRDRDRYSRKRSIRSRDRDRHRHEKKRKKHRSRSRSRSPSKRSYGNYDDELRRYAEDRRRKDKKRKRSRSRS